MASCSKETKRSKEPDSSQLHHTWWLNGGNIDNKTIIKEREHNTLKFRSDNKAGRHYDLKYLGNCGPSITCEYAYDANDTVSYSNTSTIIALGDREFEYSVTNTTLILKQLGANGVAVDSFNYTKQ